MICHTSMKSIFALIVLSIISVSTLAQNPTRGDQEDVIRVKTELVQTAVTVTNSKGEFVDSLRMDQFDLRVDGNPQQIKFLERVVTGSQREAQLTGGNLPIEPAAPKVTHRGRTIVFFVDDLHLSLTSLDLTRRTILNFVDNEMNTRDLVAIASASGKVGFLQQFTNNKQVLKAAVERLSYRPYDVRGIGMAGAPMSEYIALLIDNRSDPKLTDVYIQECMKQTSVPKKIRSAAEAIRMTCETQVKSNARSIILQASAITDDMYNSLGHLLQSSARMPGRKLAFFFSDGFLLDTGPRGRDLMSKLQQVTDQAQKSGVVIYTIDAKGLVNTALDATNNRVVDANGRLESAVMREIAATQDAMHALAGDTGGRALRNQNTFDRWINKVLDETSNYYLIAWRPEPDEQTDRKFHRVEITVTGRPDLSVRVPRGYFEGSKVATTNVAASDATRVNTPAGGGTKTPDVDLRDALSDAQSTNQLPTLLALSYLSTPANGMVVTSSMQIASRRLDYGPDGKQPSAVDLAGVVLNDKGKVVTSFKKRLNIDPPASSSAGLDTSAVIYNHRAPLAPGIYQVRVAAREVRSSRVGSAMEWIVVPDLQSHQLALSSLLIGGKVLESNKPAVPQEPAQVQLSVDRRFPRNSSLGFWLFIYNAMRDAKGSGKPNLTVQVQVLRDGRSLVTTPQRPLRTEGMSDLDRIPYGGDVALNSLTAGRYELRVTVTDVLANAATTLTSDFEVE
jgi:VWFA-related protein